MQGWESEILGLILSWRSRCPAVLIQVLLRMIKSRICDYLKMFCNSTNLRTNYTNNKREKKFQNEVYVENEVEVENEV